MISLESKDNCCGCTACAEICPRHCINMQEDDDGFLYPHVSIESCVNCGLCEKVCQFINQSAPHAPINALATFNVNEQERIKSSSGGVFTIMARKIIDEGGVVYGAKFNEKWEVAHNYTNTMDGIEAFRGAKYSQSYMGHTFSSVKKTLNEGKKVLFTGTSCQVAGLKNYLQKEYDSLLAVDCVCHGVPSPLVWKEYLKHVCDDVNKDIKSIEFRNKTSGWKNYSVVIEGEHRNIVSEVFKNNIYMQLFLRNLSLRPSCFICPAKSGKCNSDLTIADFWGIESIMPDKDDDKGMSLITINTVKGLNFYDGLGLQSIDVDYNSYVSYNPAFEKSALKSKYSQLFWRHLHQYGFTKMDELFNRMKPTFMERVKYHFYRILGR